MPDKIRACTFCKFKMTKLKNHVFESHHNIYQCSRCGYEVHTSKDDV